MFSWVNLSGCVPRVAVAGLLAVSVSWSYPIDGWQSTGIRRLVRLNMIVDKKLTGRLPQPGGMRGCADIRLHLADNTGSRTQVSPAADAGLQKALAALFARKDPSYGVTVMDISPGRPVRYAAVRPERSGVPGSVGKLAIAAGLFAELARLHPDSTAKREALLRSRTVKAGQWVVSNHHEIPVFDPATKAYASRPVRVTDEFTLWEWADHMLSASSNAAASVVWKEVMLMRAFGDRYPPTPADEDAHFQKTPRGELGEVGYAVVNDPLRKLGVAKEAWQLGSFFTGTGKRLVPVGGGSTATPAALMTYLVRLEQGAIVDAWSSLEIKKLLYMTAKRIRYASSPALDSAAVCFKSGSQYKCKPEENFACKKYHGNVENHMNSVAVVEHPGGTVYLVALMSNVLRKNSAYDHQVIATEIDKLIRSPVTAHVKEPNQ